MTTSPEYPDDADGDVLTELAAHGVDMSQPLLIEFAVEAPDDPSAQAIEQALKAHGYETEIDYDEGEPDEDGEFDPDDEEFGPSWTVYANVRMVPEYDEIIRIQAELDRIANPLGGRSDGWGALVE
jgi:hypothetical protein